MPYLKHLKSYNSLVTSYTATRAGFITLALEKNKEASPFVEEAKVLKTIAKKASKPKDLTDRRVKALHWTSNRKNRTLVYNLNVPVVKKNIDLCLLECSPNNITTNKKNHTVYANHEQYIALGELKGGTDPAGADEHWKTANSALERIRSAFNTNKRKPDIFFIGAAIEKAMAQEIYQQLTKKLLTNSANLTNEDQVISLCKWLVEV